MDEVPTTLYKYKSFEDGQRKFAADIFENNRIFLSSPDQFNDPFDCNLSFTQEATKNRLREFINSWIDKNRPHVASGERHRLVKQILKSKLTDEQYREHMRETSHLNDLGIYSVSARPDSGLMWSHYADKHCGFCVGFRRELPPFNRAHPVVYEKTRKQINLITISGVDEFITIAALQKSADWNYEREWRLFGPNRPRQFETLSSGSIVEIVFGSRMSAEHRKDLRKLADPYQPRYFDASISPTTFDIEIKPASADLLPASRAISAFVTGGAEAASAPPRRG